MSKKLCAEGERKNKGKKVKYECRKCGQRSVHEDNCCKPSRIRHKKLS